ncbi:MAG: hypothetical protein JSR25_12285, partial [Proteobacteria bacterium]|nr:hypothetical protein [Pseudomonadota bacterium]
MRMLTVLVMAGLFWPAASFAMALPDCAGDIVRKSAHVVRVERDGALVLEGGQGVVLEGIRLP